MAEIRGRFPLFGKSASQFRFGPEFRGFWAGEVVPARNPKWEMNWEAEMGIRRRR